MIRVGDLVIKNTGGNKMTVISISNGMAECVWTTESFNQGLFEIKNLVPISEYKSLFKNYYRQDKINKILG
jgi:uncharacterized protein YodC (DUF2158 family)